MSSADEITRRMNSEEGDTLEEIDMIIDMPKKEDRVIELTLDEQLRICGKYFSDAVKGSGYNAKPKIAKRDDEMTCTISVPYFFNIFRKDILAVKFKIGNNGVTRQTKILDRNILPRMQSGIETAAERASKDIGYFVGIEY